ncbi:MAG: glycerophosphodiester phosphodiesterase [Nannocystaceae bacterium]
MPPRPYLDAPWPLLFAHRGGLGVAPENTLAAFRGALELGFRYLETDVHLTADGALVTIHDPTLDRTSDAQGPVRARTLAELRGVDAGHRFTADGGRTFPFRGQGIAVPTLEEVLALDPRVRVNIEIKERDEAVVRAVYDLIIRLQVQDRVLVASEHAHQTRAFRALAGDRVATSAGAADLWRFFLAVRSGIGVRRRPAYDALQLPPTHGPLRVVTPRLVDAAHRLGLHVHVWTINDPGEMRRLLALGVDAVMSDFPALLQATAAGFAGPPRATG